MKGLMHMEFTINLTYLVKALIGIAAAILSGFVIPWIKAKTGEARADRLLALARIAVQAAEQVYKNVEKSGDQKYAYAEKFLVQHGIKLDSNEIEQAIEAAVYERSGGTMRIEDSNETESATVEAGG